MSESKQDTKDSLQVGNAAKIREALSGLLEIVCIDCKSPYEIDGKCVKCPRVVAAEAAISAPPRNCDRPECATTKAAQDVWRKEDGGKTAYYEWLLAKYESRCEMSRTKNALAELAERLTPGLVINVNGCVTAKDVDFDALQKAQRIVAELAKVEDSREGETNSDALWRCNDCIAMCRVIAEEGGAK